MAPLPSYLFIGRAGDLVDSGQRRLYCLFERLPGLLVWLTLFLALFLSWRSPTIVALFIIGFDIYWLVRTGYLAFFLSSANKRMRINLATDWRQKLADLNRKDYQLPVNSPADLYHLVIIPTYKEPAAILDRTLTALAKSVPYRDHFWVVLGVEERAGAAAKKQAWRLKMRHQNSFGQLLIACHPAGRTGEIPGKSANAAWAARRVKQSLIDPQAISYERIIVTTLDADTVVSPAYFDRLSHAYLTTPRPTQTSYQPVPLFHNNIWQAPALARVIALSTTFWFMILQERPERQGTFASHSMPFTALVKAGFWQTNVVSEDSRIFYQCLLVHNGHYRVLPLYYPISMDANVAASFWRTLRNQYLQQRRWAWGVENFPYLAYGFLKNKKISRRKKIYHLGVVLETFFSWATASLLIFLLGWLPIVLGGTAFNTSVLSFNLPRVTRFLMLTAMIGVIHIAFLTINLVPPRHPSAPAGISSRFPASRQFPASHRLKDIALLSLQWLLMPITLNFFGAFPAIEAQTRLLLGWYLGFWATEKKVDR